MNSQDGTTAADSKKRVSFSLFHSEKILNDGKIVDGTTATKSVASVTTKATLTEEEKSSSIEAAKNVAIPPKTSVRHIKLIRIGRPFRVIQFVLLRTGRLAGTFG